MPAYFAQSEMDCTHSEPAYGNSPKMYSLP
jgi:hypothetical protein